MFRIYSLAFFWICCAVLPTLLHGQGLFESALSEKEGSGGNEFLTIGGFIRSSVYMAKDMDDDQLYLQSVYGQAAIELDATISSRASAYSEIRFRSGHEYGNSLSEFDIREVYVDLETGPAGFRFGKKISTWGRGTMFNPTGKISPLDPTVRIPGKDEIYLGTWGIEGDMMIGRSMKLTATWNPLYRSSVLLIEPVSLPEYVQIKGPAFPGNGLEKGSYGVRYDLYASLADVSFYWFDGYHHWPGIQFGSFLLDSTTFQPLSLELAERAYRIRMAGLDFSFPLGSWIVRVEGAWQKPRKDHTQHGYLPFPECSYTAEIERSVSYVDLIAGYYGKYILDYLPSEADPSLSGDFKQHSELFQLGFEFPRSSLETIIDQQVGAFNRLYNYQLEEFYHTFFVLGRIELLHEQLEMSLPVAFHMTTEEWMVMPSISFSPGNGLRIEAGFSGMYGPEDSLYDLVGPALNSAYLSIKVAF